MINIKKSVCINLASSTERRESSRSLFEKHGLDVEFVEAVDGDELDIDNDICKGYNGLTKTLIGIIEKAKSENLENILIFEDDNEFSDDFNEKLDYVLSDTPEDWSVLYLSCISVGACEKVSGGIHLVSHALYGNAFIIKNTMYDEFLRRLYEYNNISDVSLALCYEKNDKFKAYTIFPCIAWQKPGISDALKGFADNGFTGELRFNHPFAKNCNNNNEVS